MKENMSGCFFLNTVYYWCPKLAPLWILVLQGIPATAIRPRVRAPVVTLASTSYVSTTKKFLRLSHSEKTGHVPPNWSCTEMDHAGGTELVRYRTRPTPEKIGGMGRTDDGVLYTSGWTVFKFFHWYRYAWLWTIIVVQTVGQFFFQMVLFVWFPAGFL